MARKWLRFVRRAEVTFSSAHLILKASISDYRNRLDALKDEIRNMEGKLLVEEDFNAGALK